MQEQGHGRAGRMAAGAKAGTAAAKSRAGDGTANTTRRSLQRGWTSRPEGAGGGGGVGSYARAESVGGGRLRDSASASEGLPLDQQAAALGLYA